MGLLNVASPVAAPIGEQDYAAIRLVADRLTVALEVTHEREANENRLAAARQQVINADRVAVDQGLFDPETHTYRRAVLEPLIEVGIASLGRRSRKLGLLIIGTSGAEADPDFMTRLASQAEAAFASRPRVRFGDAQLAVLFCGADSATAHSETADLTALAASEGLGICGGFAALAPDTGAAELVTAAEAALVLAQRVGPGTIVG
jgi:hypothetical protein